jgi:hypothetical protein
MAVPAAEAAQRYLEQLSDSDLAVLGAAAGLTSGDDARGAGFLRAHPDMVEPALASPAVFERLFPRSDPAAALSIGVSPFLLFAVVVQRGVADLATSPFVSEPFAGWRRIPVFDSASLRAHFDDPTRRLFSVEHLASYTKVASGPVFVRAPHGRLRRMRYSEIDPTRLAALVDLVDEEDKPGLYRRLGDLALFLTGVFPDWASRSAAHPVTVERLVRSVQPAAGGAGPGPSFGVDDIGALTGGSGLGGLLRVLGPRWYRLAAARSPLPSVRRALDDAAEGFEHARRFLTLLTDRYLFPLRDRWFGAPS